MNRAPAHWTSLLAIVVIGSAAGCADTSTRKPVYPVHGRVTFEGRPVDKATIVSAPAEPGARGLQSNATTAADGRYTLSTYTTGDGAPAGEYVVAIVWPGPKVKGKRSPEPGDDPDDGAGPDQLKGRYWPVGKSVLRTTVKAEKDNEIDFKLP